METSGVQRLLGYARELDVDPSKPSAARASRLDRATRSTGDRESGGVRVSLSREALQRLDGTAATRLEPAPAAAAEATPRGGSATRGSALDAYQRQAALAPEKRITLRA